MKYIGILIIAFGLTDLIGSYMEFDLWGGFLGVQLPELVWQYSSYAELILGYLLFNFGSKSSDDDSGQYQNG